MERCHQLCFARLPWNSEPPYCHEDRYIYTESPASEMWLFNIQVVWCMFAVQDPTVTTWTACCQPPRAGARWSHSASLAASGASVRILATSSAHSSVSSTPHGRMRRSSGANVGDKVPSQMRFDHKCIIWNELICMKHCTGHLSQSSLTISELHFQDAFYSMGKYYCNYMQSEILKLLS